MQQTILKTIGFATLFAGIYGCASNQKDNYSEQPPNILFIISDDQSWPHASAYGSKMVSTPGFDRIAAEGVLFNNAFVASPGCAPSRAALLTGLNCWQIEEAGTHSSSFPAHLIVFPDVLESAGYYIGFTRKGWSPGDWEITGRKRNPAGNPFNDHTLEPPTTGIANNDYAANFRAFLESRPEGKPFYFWFGASEPHRNYEEGSGLASGKTLAEAEVPGYLPDIDEVRSDMLDYALEIEWFDKHLMAMIELLEERGELENTIIVVTSDNGMPFPRAKANLYEHGIHVPLAIRWGTITKSGRTVDDLVNLIDLAPTFYEAAGIAENQLPHVEGKSLLNILKSDKTGIVDPTRAAVFSSRERHSSARWNNLGYPQRSVRTHEFLYIRNFAPDRWPAGHPQMIREDGSLSALHSAYMDIDEGPSLKYLQENYDHEKWGVYLQWAVAKRPAEELFDIKNDPWCLVNLAQNPEYQNELLNHRELLGGYLMKTNDPRVTGNGDIFETYPRLRGAIRKFPAPEPEESSGAGN